MPSDDGTLPDNADSPTESLNNPYDAIMSLSSGQAMEWKNDEESRKEYYRLKYEHEQAICGFAASVFESLRQQEYLQ